MRRPLAAFLLALLLVASAGAADPAFDAVLRDALRDVHNTGADLYNKSQDYTGAFRLYEGALRTARPLIAHRPAAQKAIDDALAAVEKESDPAKKAVALHVAIEKVRADLKAAAPKTPMEAKKAEAAKALPVAPAPRTVGEPK